ncbi:hypothetical protein BGX23_002935 [Mortierella sp. AD031]|nr:hypothetical protein BGX23_002935 [Mortierella sp. AD031]
MLAWASSRLGQALPNRWSATSDTTIKDRDGPCSGESASSRNAKEQQHQHVLQEQEHTHGPPHASAAATANHRYQSFSSVKDDLKSGIGPKGRTKQDKSLQQQQQHRQPESTKGSRSYPDGSQDGSFRASYSYSTPKTAMRTSLALLDTSSSALSNSILSRTRRASDRKMRQHQLEIQRDMAAPLMEQQLLADEVIVGSPFKSSLRERKSTQELQENEAEDEQDMDNDVETTTDSKARPTSSRRSSTVNRSIRYSFHGSTSPTLSIQHERSGSTTASKRHSLFNNSRQGSSSSRQLHRVLSGPIFIPNPRGIAPTPSPDVSMELVRKPFDATTSTSKAQTVTQVVSKDQLFRHSQEQLRRYETQLDERIQTVQANNQRLQELRSLMESQGMALTVRTVQCDGDEDSEYDDEEGEQQWRIESAERAEERLALEKTKDLLEQSLTKQQRLGEQLVQERSKNQELEARIEGMSSQLKGVLEMDLAQSKEIELVHEQTVKDREQWERQLRQEKQKREELQSSMEAAMAAKDRQFAESSAQERQSSDHESQALAAQVASLNQELEELKERMRRNETKAQAKLDQQEHQIHEHKDRGQELERQLEQERNRRDDDQEARVDDLIEEVEEKEQDVQELRVMLADYDELLQSRQSELNEAMELVESLQDQLQDHQTNHASDLQRIQEQHKKDQKQRHAEIRELKRELAQEKEASHEHQKRIELLLASHQESTQMHEGKIRDLQEELRQRNSQLSQSKSSASTVIKTVKGHLETIGLQQRMVEEQEQILLEKEGRIEELEQELKLAQQRHHTVVADLEQDVRGLERERAELVDMVKLARQQGMEERDDELTQDQEQERQMLESLLEELDPSFQIDSQQVDGNHSTQSDEGRRTVNQLYAILQEKIQEQKQHQLDLVMQRDLQEDKMDEQREQLEECETEIEAQHEQLLRLEADRRELEEQQIRIQGELDAARDDIQHLQRQLQDKNALRASKNAPLSGRASLSASRQRSSIAPNDDVQTLSLFDKISSLEQERARLLDHIKSLEESVQDLTEAGKTLRDKYEERVATLRQEVVKNRRLLVRQEGQLFLYLSVIEKLKIAMRDAKIEPPRDTKIEPSRDTTDTHANNKVGHGDQT